MLPKLYKYLDFVGAVKTLAGRCFKYAKPSDFNDVEDLTVGSLYPEPLEDALRRIDRSFTDVLLQNIDRQPTCDEPLRSKMAELQGIYRRNPQAAEVVKAEIAAQGEAAFFGRNDARARSERFVDEVNAALQDYRVLCVTTHATSERMWTEYADQHRGVVLRLVPNVEGDSVLRLMSSVTYQELRPSLYENTLDFISNSLFGDQQADRMKMLRRVIYTKTLRWHHEGEYRVAVPIGEGERPWNTLKFHADEIAEVHLGLGLSDIDRTVIRTIATRLNPATRIFTVERGECGDLRLV